MASTSAAGAAGSKLTKLESALYRAAQSAPGGIITQEQISVHFKRYELEEQLMAINGLLKKSLFSAQNLNGKIQYEATAKAEASMMGKLDENESMVYQHIKDSRNEGIWTKQLKNRTGLHQTIINRCLKSLEQKSLVKAVKSVKYPTRKIYMLFGLTPSIELSGGPWYTDNELDTGFINELSLACLNFIRSKSFPKNGQSRALFPTSHTSQLPSASSVHSYLRNSNLTETKLELEHVISLLDILVYDEQIEKLPVLSFGNALNGLDDDNYTDSGTDTGGSGSDSESASGFDSESSAEETDDDMSKGKRNSKKVEVKEEDADGDEQDDAPTTSRKRKRSSTKSVSRKKSKSGSSSKSSSKSKKSSSRSSSKSRSRSRNASPSFDDSESESDASSASSGHGRKRSSKKKRSSNGKNGSLSFDDLDPFVYRAVRPHSVRVGWTETPCGHCPVFDFCDDAGPVNAASCQYFGGKEDELGRKLTSGWIDAVVDGDGQDAEAEDEDVGFEVVEGNIA